uniref:Radical S-adenosyl methionine domain-containing protein n=1 Tax=Anolis carolinensis TaxID=28377 RepID=A0A803SSC3_ANOCA|nr:PREDICTED: radical S-adenosyl methionine domain-containing protein 1, mitochondrial [Anolis carolinensis]|eukprot:XP_008102717.1 PREDICTED: radical S-adenosyl methionine domain-containing protein 1, mitochondrial [Anolis carolinensis]
MLRKEIYACSAGCPFSWPATHTGGACGLLSSPLSPSGPFRRFFRPVSKRQDMGRLLVKALPATGLLRRIRPPARDPAFRGVTQAPRQDSEAQAALYLHWPYCEKRCSYCNFNKYIPRNIDESRMRNCLIQEARTLIQFSQVQRITSVYFGGGTPSLASPLTIAAVLDAISRDVFVAEGTEITLEANPTSADALCLAEFQKAGVNRLSVGIQSLNDAELQLLGRNHSAYEALRTLEEAKKLFPGRISVDLIFGLPDQTTASWVQDLEALLAMCDDHISLYQLTLERGTSLFKQVHQGFLPLPDPDIVSEMYECARNILQNAGFHQYEVSNFARNGALSTHNLSYWRGSQYIGVGPGAHGRFVPWGNGKVYREARIQTLEPDIWMKEVLAFGHGTRKQTPLTRLEILEEVLMLGLRMDVGITHQHWLQFAPDLNLWDVFGQSEEVQELEAHGLMILDDRGLRCSWKGLAVLDSLLLTLLNQLQQAWAIRDKIFSET